MVHTIKEKERVQIPNNELSKLIKAYNTIGEFLETFLDHKILYKEDFLHGLKQSVKEVLNKKTKKIATFNDFVS